MNINFVLDEDHLAFFILYKKMFDESKELEDIKAKLYSDNNLGYKKNTRRRIFRFVCLFR